MESINDYLTARELAGKWGVSVRMISHYCTSGLLDGAIKRGRIWFIPKDVNKPVDHRMKEHRQGSSHADIFSYQKVDLKIL